MAKLILPDSNIYIDAIRRGVDPFLSFADFIQEHEFCTCGMVMLEVCRGICEPDRLQKFRDRFAVMIYLPTTNAIWERAQHLAWSMDRQRLTIPAQDHVIAACALQTGATVLTHDKHFHGIPGLNVIDRL